MKKRFFCMSLILVMLLSASAHAIQSRSITSVPHLSFDGNRQQRFPVCSHIAVTGGIPSADIVFGIGVRGLVTVDHAGRAKVRLGTADRASDVDSFHVNLLSVSDILERGCKVMNSQGIPSDTARNWSFPKSSIWKRGMRRRPC